MTTTTRAGNKLAEKFNNGAVSAASDNYERAIVTTRPAECKKAQIRTIRVTY